jgi:Asp-tRNA(Asn)/Glu-tRNA(Gln) amidotransferase A subunit family amidase
VLFFPVVRRLPATALAVLSLLACLLCGVSSARGAELNLEKLSGAEAEQMLQAGTLTSVELTEAYLDRIAAISKAGPGLNVVTQFNKEAIAEAEKSDMERALGKNLGPAMGLPILLKDIIDAKGMYTSAGDWALRESFPEKDSGVAKQLRAHGLIILGKVGLSEWANSFGSQPSGFSNLTGQVLNANDTAQGPSGSSSGSGAAAASGLAALTIGTETSGSIISPAREQSIIGLRPTVGLVPGYGISPILASQDTAGPMERTVTDAAMVLQSIAEVPGTDPEADAEYEGMMGPNFHANGDIPLASFTKLPNYMSALTTNFVKGKRIGYNGNTCTGLGCTPTPSQEAVQKAKEVLEAAGATLVADEPTTVAVIPALPTNYEAHATIDEYYSHLGPEAPVKSLVEEVALDLTNPQEALKDGNSAHKNESEVDATPGGVNQKAYEEKLPIRKAAYHEAIEKMMNEPSGGGGPVIAVIGSVPSGPQAGYPQVTVPMGYTPTQRRAVAVSVNGGAYDERDLIGVSYVIEQATHLRKTPAEVNPAAYRCAHTATPAPFAARGHCNPNYESLMTMLGGSPKLLPFALETASAGSLQAKLEAGTLTSKELVEAELYRAALTNAKGPAIQAIRKVAANAIQQAEASDARRAKGESNGPLEGIPVLVDDTIDVAGLPTSGGSIALQDNLPTADSTIVARLKAEGAIVLGDTNVTELGAQMETSSPTAMPQGYSSLGGQALLPSDTNKSPGGSSAGSAGSVSVGLAPLSIGVETSTEAAQLIVPSSNSGLVGLKPTVGLVSRKGVLPVARSQDSPGPIAQTVSDVATGLSVLAGPDVADPGTAGQPNPLPDYTAGLSATALSGKKIAIVALVEGETGLSTVKPTYEAAVAKLAELGATTGTVAAGTAPVAPSVIPFEFHRDLDSYLGESPGGGADSLQQIIEYNKANPVEGLKFGQAKLLAAQEVDTEAPLTKSTYEANLATGRSEARTAIDNMLSGGYAAIMVPIGDTLGNALVGIADRAGYPVLTVPAGFAPQNSNAGGDPVGVAFIGTAYSEAELLADAYAFEQGMLARQSGPEYMRSVANPGFSGVPSQTNQSMYRCLAGSAFYKPYACNPGEVPLPAAEETPVTPAGPTAGHPSGGAPAATPAPVELKLALLKRLLGKGEAMIKVHVSGAGKLALSGKGVKPVARGTKQAGIVWLPIEATGKSLAELDADGQVKVKVKIVFTASDGTKVSQVRKLTLIEK